MTMNNKVNTSNLKVGMLYSYDELCKAVGENPIESNGSKQQTCNWKRYFDYTYKNGKYKITCIYKQPFAIELEEWHREYCINSGKYYLLMLFANEKNKPYILKTRTQLYNEIKFDKNISNEDDIGIIDDIVDSTPNIFSKKFHYLNAILKDLRKNYIITWDKIYMIKKSENAPYTEEGWDIENKNNITYNNDTDRIRIMTTEFDVLKKFYNDGKIREIDMTEISRVHLFSEFHQQVNKLLNERYGWVNCYKAYKIRPIVNNSDQLDEYIYEYKQKMDNAQQNIVDYILDKEEAKYGTNKGNHLNVNQIAMMTIEAWKVACQILFTPEMSNEEIQFIINSI